MTNRRLGGFLILLAAAEPMLGQESRGTILGRVTDTTGSVIANAEIRAVNNATQAAAASRTNEAGNYTIPYLLPGAYTLTVETAGFKKYQRDGIQVRVSDTLEVNVQMVVGDVSERVEVTAATPLLETSLVQLGQVVDQRRVTELPIQAGNAFELVLLAPGVANATDMRLRKAGFNNAPSQITTDGNPQYSNEFTIDGVTNSFSSGTQPRVAFSPPQTAITEFKVQTTSFDASLGHTTGSAVNVSTASGTNQLHGELHHWFSSSALDSYDLFQKRDGLRKPVYADNRYGGSVGGPVYMPRMYDGRNKTFFYYTYEANKWGGPGTFTSTVPTDAQRQGDFTALAALGSTYTIYDPRTIRDAGGGRFSRQPFDGQRIPQNIFDPVARNVLNFFPRPNLPGTRDFRNNYTTPTKAFEDYYVHLARVDHNFSERHRAFVRVHYDWWEEEKDNRTANLATGIFLNRINRGLAMDDVVVLNPTSILNLRYGLTQQDFPERRRSRGFDLASLGFSPALVSLIPDKTMATFPNIAIGGTLALSGWESGDGTNTSMVHSFTANLTTLKGNHNLRYGLDVRVYREFGNRFQRDVSPALTFDTTWTRGPSDNSAGAAIGQELAAFLVGLPGGQMDRSASYAEQERFWAVYLQDDWKLTPKLTLSAGVRYEYETPITERFDRSVKGFAFGAASPIEAQARANYTTPIPELPRDQFRVPGGLTFAGGAAGRSLWAGENNNLMPRIGLAYQLTSKTVIRSGYGMFFETIGTNRSTSIQTGFSQSTPVIVSRDNGLSFIASTANPFPDGLQAALGSAGGLTTFLGQGISFYPARRPQPYAQRWSLGFQRQLPAEFVLDVAYVGNRGTRLPVSHNLNFTPGQYLSRSPERDNAAINFLSRQVANPFFGLGPVYTRNISVGNLLRPYPHFGNITAVEPIGYSWYHAMQVRAEKRFSRGYTLQFAYTWSKNMEATEFLNDSDPGPYEAISSFDRLHRVAASGIFELPFGKGRRLASNVPGWLNQAIGGWQLNAVVQRQSGPPLGFGNAIFRGDLKNIALPKNQRSVDRWFNTDAGFERSAALQLASNIRTFPLRFSGIRADGQARWDLSLIKYFPIRERMKLQFRAEAYNAWNHPNLPGPNTAVTNTAFGTITGELRFPRRFQLALKLTF